MSIGIGPGIGVATVVAVAATQQRLSHLYLHLLQRLLALLRACFKIVAVAAICAAVVHLRDAQGDSAQSAAASKVDWVRTVDGWEPISVLTLGPPPQGPPTLHPVVVASLQLGLSVFALLAMPTVSRAVRKY